MRGYLTYTVAVLAVAYGVLGFIIGALDGVSAMNSIWLGLGFFGLRRAM